MRILYVDIDSLRPDHLSCYGYHRPTSPVLDRIAAQGVRFNQYFCSDSPCNPSRAACFSARPGIRNGVVAHENTPPGAQLRYLPSDRGGATPMWMHQLARAGYRTVSFSSFANRHLAGWFHFGFREFYLSSLKNGNENADEVNEVALPWFKRHAHEDNWFVHLNYWDPHTFYTEPLSYMEQMAQHPAPVWPDAATIESQQHLTGGRTPRTLWNLAANEGYGRSPVPTMPDQIANRADFEHLINGYDGAIRYVDEQFDVILQTLADQGVLDETAIIISADHAEAFGELGQYMEHGTVSPAVNRIPLIVRWPGITDSAAGTASDALLTNVDLAPTVAEALGLDLPSGWTGQSFLSLLQGNELAQPRPQLFLGHGLHTRQRAVFDGRWLYIRTYHPAIFEYPPHMLFDLERDPNQEHDLAQEQPERVQQMAAQLAAWEEEQVAATGLPDPMREIQHLAPYMLARFEDHIQRLRDQNREEDAQRLLAQWERIPTDYAPEPLSQ